VFGGNCFLPRRLVFDLGGFHPDGMPPELLRYRGNGEGGLMQKFKRAGLRACYDPRATAYHVISADRLTVDYLCRRAYNEGVSRSFAQIRAEHLVEGAWEGDRGVRHYLRRAREMPLRDLMRAIARRFRRSTTSRVSPVHSEIQGRIDAAHLAGWQFHQDAVKSDSALLQYVIRENFLDAEDTSAK